MKNDTFMLNKTTISVLAFSKFLLAPPIIANVFHWVVLTTKRENYTLPLVSKDKSLGIFDGLHHRCTPEN